MRRNQRIQQAGLAGIDQSSTGDDEPIMKMEGKRRVNLNKKIDMILYKNLKKAF